MWKYISSFLLLLSLTAQAQEPAKEPREWDWNPSFIRAGVDVTRLLGTAFKDFRSGAEGYVEFDTDQFFILGEYGFEANNRKEKYFTYSNSGQFFRVGFEYNLTPYSKDRNVIALGIRYARSTFSDQLSFSRDSTLFSPQELHYANDDLSAQWIEITNSMRVRVWKQMFFGATIRIKTLKQVSGITDLVPYDVPGFGRHRKNGTEEKSTVMGISYYIAWTIPFREKKIPPKPAF